MLESCMVVFENLNGNAHMENAQDLDVGKIVGFMTSVITDTLSIINKQPNKMEEFLARYGKDSDIKQNFLSEINQFSQFLENVNKSKKEYYLTYREENPDQNNLFGYNIYLTKTTLYNTVQGDYNDILENFFKNEQNVIFEKKYRELYKEIIDESHRPDFNITEAKDYCQYGSCFIILNYRKLDSFNDKNMKVIYNDFLQQFKDHPFNQIVKFIKNIVVEEKMADFEEKTDKKRNFIYEKYMGVSSFLNSYDKNEIALGLGVPNTRDNLMYWYCTNNYSYDDFNKSLRIV